MAYEIELHRGVGPLSLGMSQVEVAAVLGRPDEETDPSKYSFLEDEDRPYLRYQIVETRSKTGDLPIVDLVYFKEKLASIKLHGDSSEVLLHGRPLAKDRRRLLTELQALGGNVFINGENYYFEKEGIVLTRTKARKDINYAEIIDPEFQKFRFPFDRYKPHNGPIVP